jgi:hypothetical protein
MSWKRGLMKLAPVTLIGVWACYNAPVETPAPKTVQETDVKVEQNVKNKVDILFMVDNSPSMTPKQNELQARFPELIKILDSFGQTSPASYHIGVVTSDLGAGQFTLSNGQCHPNGDGGKLQAIGAAAAAGCMAPTGGVNYIDYNQLMKDVNGNATSNLPAGQDLATTFTCMASVGANGCGFEHQLESVYRALKNPPPENAGFLRPDALLVVVWVTDEDDCSADPNTDLFDPSAAKAMPPPAGYGTLASYRCTEFSIECNGSLMPYADSGGALMGCTDAAPSLNHLIPVSKYINFFSKPAGAGGIKVDPQDVILVDLTAPDSPVESILANPQQATPGPYVTCPGPVDGKTCAVVLQHSCIAPTNNAFFGDPAVRIRQVVNSVLNKQTTSICDTSYQSALQSLGQLIVSQIGAGCISSPFQDANNPDCIVEDVTTNNDGSTTINELQRCDKVNNVAPCWKLESKPVCDANKMPQGCCPVICAHDGDPGQHYGATICRNNACNGGDPPPNTTARVACSTIAVSKDPQTGNLPMCGAPLP